MTQQNNIENRVIKALDFLIEQKKYVSLIDVFLKVGLLQVSQINLWKRCKIPYLEQVIDCDKEIIVKIIKVFNDWTKANQLIVKEIVYFANTKHAIPLKISNDPTSELEIIYRTHYFQNISLQQQQLLLEKIYSPDELIVFKGIRDANCMYCKKALLKNMLFFIEEDKSLLCLSCAELDHLIFLSSGNSSLTLKAKKYSSLVAIVLKYSHDRRRYKRQGVLIEQQALKKAEQN